MLIVGAYKRQRLSLDVQVGMTVQEMKEIIKDRLGISLDVYRQENKVMTLTYAGADLDDSWVFSDLGILPGTTIKIQLKENIKPVLYIKCSHNQEKISVLHDITIINMRIDQIRSMASMKSGLPVGIFRLTTDDGREMFDSHSLDDYGVDVGHIILLQTWDGWSEFLNLAIMGYTQEVISQLSAVDVIARYQLKVALFIASHFGHLDLARYILRQGIRADDPTGYHPARTWCKDSGHIDSLKCPVHEATLCGHVNVLRLFVLHDITCLKVKDGYGQEPLSIALRQKIKNCATFLLTKQWTKINITKTFAVHLATYAKLKKWCERAKDRALVKYGPAKSSLKRRSFNSGPLISHGIFVDGFSQSPMTGKSKAALLKDEKVSKDKESRRFCISLQELVGSHEDPETYFKTLTATQDAKTKSRAGKFPLRWSKSLVAPKLYKAGRLPKEKDSRRANWKVRSQSTPEFSKLRASSMVTEDSETNSQETVKLPPIASNRNIGKTSQSQASSDVTRSGRTTENISRTSSNRKDNSRNDTSFKSAFRKQPFQSRGNLRLVQEDFKIHPPFASEQNERFKRRLDGSTSLVSSNSALRFNDILSSETNASVSTDDPLPRIDKFSTSKRRPRRSFRVTKVKTADGFISQGKCRRPFFYHQGLREDELVDSALEIVAKHRGDSSHERAVRSMTLANSFSEKPWLGQVRLALNVTSNSLKRSLQEV